MTINESIALDYELDGLAAPQAVASFVSLVQDGFYDGLTCHRLTTQGIFVLQCGDPNGDGTGGPDYRFGPIENSPLDDVYATGVIAMARQSGDGSSMGSQFFIVYDESTIPSDAAGGYTVIGRVTAGLDALVSEVIAAGVDGGAPDALRPSPRRSPASRSSSDRARLAPSPGSPLGPCHMLNNRADDAARAHSMRM